MGEKKLEIELPEGFQAELKDGKIIVRCQKGELARELPKRKLQVTCEPGKVCLGIECVKNRALIGSWQAHIKNMIKGLQESWEYTLKVCSSHFPTSVKLQGNQLLIENFFGEHYPRKVTVPAGVDVKVQGEQITVKSADIELAGRTAGLIERATRLRKKDRRVFCDGIFITEKAKSKK